MAKARVRFHPLSLWTIRVIYSREIIALLLQILSSTDVIIHPVVHNNHILPMSTDATDTLFQFPDGTFRALGHIGLPYTEARKEFAPTTAQIVSPSISQVARKLDLPTRNQVGESAVESLAAYDVLYDRKSLARVRLRRRHEPYGSGSTTRRKR